MTTLDDSESSTQPSPSGYQLSRLNAVSHGVLSQHTVLPWEDQKEWNQLLDAFTAEYDPQGPTEHSLVAELATITWRRRRLRIAESAVHSGLMEFAAAEFLGGPDWELLAAVHYGCPEPPLARAHSPEKTAEFRAAMDDYRRAAVEAIHILKSSTPKAYAEALSVLNGHTVEWWDEQCNDKYGPKPAIGERFRLDAASLRRFLIENVLPWCDRRVGLTDAGSEARSTLQATALVNSLENASLERLERYETSLDRKFERKLTMLVKLQELRRGR